jgi:hypothetical protein
MLAEGGVIECAAIVDVLRRFGAVGLEDVEQANRLLSRVVAMLSKMCR